MDDDKFNKIMNQEISLDGYLKPIEFYRQVINKSVDREGANYICFDFAMKLEREADLEEKSLELEHLNDEKVKIGAITKAEKIRGKRHLARIMMGIVEGIESKTHGRVMAEKFILPALWDKSTLKDPQKSMAETDLWVKVVVKALIQDKSRETVINEEKNSSEWLSGNKKDGTEIKRKSNPKIAQIWREQGLSEAKRMKEKLLGEGKSLREAIELIDNKYCFRFLLEYIPDE